MKRFLLLLALTGLLSSSVIVLGTDNASAAKPLPQVCGYCDGGGGCHWVRDADDYWYWVCP